MTFLMLNWLKNSFRYKYFNPLQKINYFVESFCDQPDLVEYESYKVELSSHWDIPDAVHA